MKSENQCSTNPITLKLEGLRKIELSIHNFIVSLPSEGSQLKTGAQEWEIRAILHHLGRLTTNVKSQIAFYERELNAEEKESK